MLTFLELYQTLLGFVFFKIYTDAGLVYPPPLDAKKDEGAAGVGAFSLEEAKAARPAPAAAKSKVVEVDGKRISSKDVRQTIKSIAASGSGDADVEMSTADAPANEDDEEFVEDNTEEDPEDAPSAPAFTTATLPTLKTLSTLPQSTSAKLFAPYTFWLSRETSRPIFEFLVRASGGRIGWPASSGSGSPFEEDDESITHVIIDRPLVQRANETEAEKERRRRRKYVQPQWVVDCINAGRILLEDLYAQGKTLPPHLSPFGEHAEAYDPTAGLTGAAEDEEMDEEVEGEDDAEVDAEDSEEEEARPAKSALKAAATAEDAAALRAAELAAEAAGIDFGTFEKEAKKAQKKVKKGDAPQEEAGEQNMNKMMMSNKQRKLYERMKYGQKKRAEEVSVPGHFLVFGVILTVLTATRPGTEEADDREREEAESEGLSSLDLRCACSFCIAFYRVQQSMIHSALARGSLIYTGPHILQSREDVPSHTLQPLPMSVSRPVTRSETTGDQKLRQRREPT